MAAVMAAGRPGSVTGGGGRDARSYASMVAIEGEGIARAIAPLPRHVNPKVVAVVQVAAVGGRPTR